MKMKKDILEMRKWIILILIAIFSYWGLNNFDKLLGVINTGYKVLEPFILGGVIAFVLNILVNKIEKYLNKWIKNRRFKLVRFISIILSLLIFILVIVFTAFLLIPELIENIQMLMGSVPELIGDAQNSILNLLDKYPDIQNEISKMFAESGNVSTIISNVLNYFITGAIGFIGSLVSSFITIFTAIIFAIYMLAQKEYLIRGTKKVLYSLLNKKRADKLVEIGTLANKTFSKFISGQCLEAIILGGLMFIAFTISGYPYALMLAVLTAITSLIPIFGALIAMVIGAILIGIGDPVQAIIFVIVFQVVQQIEGNFIYPRVVGASVGLSPLWTLLAITVGGNLFGIPGILLGLPVASVLYALIKELVNGRLKNKAIKIS